MCGATLLTTAWTPKPPEKELLTKCKRLDRVCSKPVLHDRSFQWNSHTLFSRQAIWLGWITCIGQDAKERCKGDNFCLRYLGSQGPGTFVSLVGIRPCGLGSYCPSLWYVLTSTTDPKWRAQTVKVRHLSNGLARFDLRREATCRLGQQDVCRVLQAVSTLRFKTNLGDHGEPVIKYFLVDGSIFAVATGHGGFPLRLSNVHDGWIKTKVDKTGCKFCFNFRTGYCMRSATCTPTLG